MLGLDDQRWSDLSHAYGRATDVPALLRALANPEDAHEKALFGLWSRLYHQGDIYDASYAAVPHLIRLGIVGKPPVRFDYFVLPSSIEIARVRGNGPEMPAFLKADYEDAMASLIVLAEAQKGYGDKSLKRAVLAAKALARGDVDAAESILDEDEA